MANTNDKIVVVPDDAVIFVRHPRHFLVKIEGAGWVRYNPSDIEDVLLAKHGELANVQKMIRDCKINPDRIIENVVSPNSDEDVTAAMEAAGVSDADYDAFSKDFSEEQDYQLLFKVIGGNSWFVWWLGTKKEETL
jgi:hypothetical protein